jgi:hypothetical protein
MASVSSGTCDLYVDVPKASRALEWRALIRHQAQTLMGLLHSLQTTVTGMQGRIQTVDTRIHSYPNGEEI